MRKKMILILAVVLLMTAFFIGCNTNNETEVTSLSEAVAEETEEDAATEADNTPQGIPESTLKITVGLVYLEGGYETELVADSVRALTEVSSIQITVIEEETDDGGAKAAIESLIDEGCEIIFASGIDEGIISEAADENKSVNFEVYGQELSEESSNLSAFYARLYQQQYLNGIIAAYVSDTGNIAYISEQAENEDIRRLNAFALGVYKVNPEAVVHYEWLENAESYELMLSSFESQKCDVYFKYEIDDELLGFAQQNGYSVIGKSDSDYEGIVELLEPSLAEYLLEKTRSTLTDSYSANDIMEGWFGIESFEIDEDAYSMLNIEALIIIQDKADKIIEGEWDVFTGPISDSYGQQIIPEGVVLPDEDLFYMLWYVGNIDASQIPMG